MLSKNKTRLEPVLCKNHLRRVREIFDIKRYWLSTDINISHINSRKKMDFKLFIALFALGIPAMVQGYSKGAPEAECGTMTPRHHVEPQSGPFPYTITLGKRAIKAGETIEVIIKGKNNDDNFKGLIVQARVGDTPIGSFDVSPTKQWLQLLDCGSRGVSFFSASAIYTWSRKKLIKCLASGIDFRCWSFFVAHCYFFLPSERRHSQKDRRWRN